MVHTLYEVYIEEVLSVSPYFISHINQ